jgi:RimJ/RimL family protein N-acetyltransferase
MEANSYNWDNQILQGRFITVRPLCLSDEPLLKKYFSTDLFEYYPYVYKDCAGFIDSVLKMKAVGDFFSWVIIENKTQELIGATSCAQISQQHKKCEIGWTWFGKPFQKLGYNVESKLLLLSFLFEQMHFNRVELKTDEKNTASNMAMQKLGFVKEGLFRNHMVMPSGRIRHTVYYSIIPEEWADTKKLIQERLEKKCLLKNPNLS